MFEYVCVNCGNHEIEDFWYCVKCDSGEIAEIEVDSEGTSTGVF